MAAGTETDVKATTVITLNMTVKSTWEDGMACWKKQQGSFQLLRVNVPHTSKCREMEIFVIFLLFVFTRDTPFVTFSVFLRSTFLQKMGSKFFPFRVTPFRREVKIILM